MSQLSDVRMPIDCNMINITKIRILVRIIHEMIFHSKLLINNSKVGESTDQNVLLKITSVRIINSGKIKTKLHLSKKKKINVAKTVNDRFISNIHTKSIFRYLSYYSLPLIVRHPSFCQIQIHLSWRMASII